MTILCALSHTLLPLIPSGQEVSFIKISKSLERDCYENKSHIQNLLWKPSDLEEWHAKDTPSSWKECCETSRHEFMTTRMCRPNCHHHWQHTCRRRCRLGQITKYSGTPDWVLEAVQPGKTPRPWESGVQREWQVVPLRTLSSRNSNSDVPQRKLFCGGGCCCCLCCCCCCFG